MRRLLMAVAVAASTLLAAACTASTGRAAASASASPLPPAWAWLVHYEIGGQQLTDYWFYVHRRWVFDQVFSNPDAVRLYRMSPSQYATAAGCGH